MDHHDKPNYRKLNEMHPVLRLLAERVIQFMFWIGLGYFAIHFGLPELGLTLADMYQTFRAYFVDAPAAEQAGWTLFGIF